MDQMDIDHTVEVPDTPDRLTTHGINHRSGYKEENQCSSTPSNSLRHRFLEDGTKDQPMVIDSPNNSAAFSRTAHIFRKGLKEKNPIFLGHDSVHGHSDRPLNISRSSSSSQDGSFLDRAERNSHKQPIFGKRSGLANGVSSLHGPKNFRTSSRDAREEAENVRKVGSRAGFGDGIDIVDNIPRVNKQKRLVRNGCISPNNIAKAKQLSGKDINGSVAFEHNNNGSVASNAPTTSIDIRELVAEDSDSHKRKGKGVISHPCLSKVPDFRNKNLPDRSSMSFSQNAKDTSDRIRGKSIDESGGWRSTRNHTREINISSPDKERYPRQNEKERKEKGISVATGDNYPNDLNLVSSEHLSSQTLMESGSQPKARLGRLKGPRSAAETIKRQKQMGPRSSGECSTSVSDDPEVVFLSSSSQAAANSKSTSTSVNNLQPVIEVDEFSPELRHNNTHDEDARARQLEADERLARELQEQLYNEMPAFGVGEVDEHIALALQQQGSSNHRFSQSRPTGFDARGSFMSNLHRQSQSRSSNVPRRGSLSRASTLGRMTRLRSRFPGQPRTILPSRGRTSLFPADMDVDMRMHILGALEEFSDLGVTPGILQAQRDFNENDYEMLLALDENNDQHGGASVHQINGLPQSTVQSDNFEEACAICLDNPTIGDTIRHLPCLHKFHKDCIDPWLRRRTSCPVCKSSIT